MERRQLFALLYFSVIGALAALLLTVKDRRWRFNLRILLILMTLIAMLLGLLVASKSFL